MAASSGLKRRRCSHDVGMGSTTWECTSDTGGFLFGSTRSFENTFGLEIALDAAMLSSEAAPGRRKELAGLSEASEEEECNEQQQQQQMLQRPSTLEEYDAGTLTPPPPQTRFRPIAPSPREEDELEGEQEVVHPHHNSCSTEGSLCSFKVNDVIMPSDDEDDDDDEDVVDDEDSFGGIAPGLGHRRLRPRCSPMQTEDESSMESGGLSAAAAEKYRELDIGLIEQD